MASDVFRFEFEPSVQMTEAEMTLHVATFAVEGLFGESQVRLEASYHLDKPHRTITVDAATEVGAAIVKIFTRLLGREFGEHGFHVRPENMRRRNCRRQRRIAPRNLKSKTVGA